MSEVTPAAEEQNASSIRIDLNELLPNSSVQLLSGPHNNLRLQRYLTHQLRNQNWHSAEEAPSSDMNQSGLRERQVPPTTDARENQRDIGNSWTTFLSQNPEVNIAVKFILQYIPFIVIVLLKEGYEHGTGIVVLVSLAMAFWHSNKTVHHEVVQQSEKNLGSLAVASFNLISCIAFVSFLSEDSAIFKSAFLWPPVSSKFSSVWALLWHVIITDCILKLVTVLLKALFTALPAFVVPYVKRGKYYVFMEITSQLYRSLATLQPWMFYLLSSNDGDSDMMDIIGKLNGVILCLAYITCKGYSIIPHVSRWRAAFSKLKQRTNLGTVPTGEQLQAAGPLCPICQDEYNNPTCLQCRHIFCEACLAVWLSKEKTCPMCRANVAEDPLWKDGSTTFFVQWF